MTVPQSTSSRLLKKERNAVAKQTALFVLGTVVLLLGFIFIILPLFIGVVNSFLNKNPFPTQEAIMLQTPLVDAPVEATNQRELTLTGYSPTGDEVVLVLNGSESTSVSKQEDGRFELQLSLINGSNSIAVFARDNQKNESPTSKEFIVLFDQDTPTLTLTFPQNEQSFDKKTTTITIEGTTDPDSQILVNGRLGSVNAEGGFRATVLLQDGDNKLLILAKDKAGNATEQELLVKRTS